MKVVTTTTYRQKKGDKFVDHEPGSEIDEKKEVAEPLLARGLLLRPGETPKARAIPPARPEGEALVKEIVGAIGQVDLDNEESVTASGKPVVAVLEKALGYDISADERDQAWSLHQRGGK